MAIVDVRSQTRNRKFGKDEVQRFSEQTGRGVRRLERYESDLQEPLNQIMIPFERVSRLKENYLYTNFVDRSLKRLNPALRQLELEATRFGFTENVYESLEKGARCGLVLSRMSRREGDIRDTTLQCAKIALLSESIRSWAERNARFLSPALKEDVLDFYDASNPPSSFEVRPGSLFNALPEESHRELSSIFAYFREVRSEFERGECSPKVRFHLENLFSQLDGYSPRAEQALQWGSHVFGALALTILGEHVDFPKRFYQGARYFGSALSLAEESRRGRIDKADAIKAGLWRYMKRSFMNLSVPERDGFMYLARNLGPDGELALSDIKNLSVPTKPRGGLDPEVQSLHGTRAKLERGESWGFVFAQLREVGRGSYGRPRPNQRQAVIYKGRTMGVYGHDGMAEKVDHTGKPIYTSRLNSVGAIVRRLKLDEAFQIIQVATGVLRLQGDRPRISDEYDAMTPLVRNFNEKHGAGFFGVLEGFHEVHLRDSDELREQLREARLDNPPPPGLEYKRLDFDHELYLLKFHTELENAASPVGRLLVRGKYAYRTCKGLSVNILGPLVGLSRDVG